MDGRLTAHTVCWYFCHVLPSTFYVLSAHMELDLFQLILIATHCVQKKCVYYHLHAFRERDHLGTILILSFFYFRSIIVGAV